MHSIAARALDNPTHRAQAGGGIPCAASPWSTSASLRSDAVTSPERTLDPSSLGDHIDRLFRAAWALSGSRVDAEDLVQETFARVLAKPRRIRNEDDLG